MLYIVIGANKYYLPRGLIEKYGLKGGMLTPFTGYRILQDDEKEKKASSRSQEVYQAPKDDY